MTVSPDPLDPGDLPHLRHLGDCSCRHDQIRDCVPLSAIVSANYRGSNEAGIEVFQQKYLATLNIEVHGLDCCEVE